MMNIVNILKDNPYIVGIIVFFITWPINNLLTKKTSKKEYYKRVNDANSEIVELLTDYIISFKTIDKALIREIIHAVSIEWNVSIKDLYDLNQLKSILIKEFIGIKLIPQDQKKEIIELIITNVDNAKTTQETIKEGMIIPQYNNFKIETTVFATMMTFIVTLMTIVVYFIGSPENLFNLGRTNDSTVVAFITLTSTAIIVEITMLLLLKIKKIEKQTSKKENKREQDKKEILSTDKFTL